jgi:Ala-tRNA(Pro) deacylase
MYIHEFLRSRGVSFETLLYPPASSSTKRARSAGVPGRKVAKAVLVNAGGSFVVAVLPSTTRIDLAQLGDVLGVQAEMVRLASDAELYQTFPDCEPGVVPPFGRLYGLKTLIESSLAESPDIVVSANTRHEGIRLRVDDFESIEQPIRAAFTRPVSTMSARPLRVRRPRNRRAG